MRTARYLGIVFAIAGVATAALAQQPVGQTKALSHAIHAVNDLDTTLAFYRDVFGIDGKAVDFPNPGVPLLTNAPGVTLRLSMVALPGGTRFEFTHFKGLERQPAQAKYTDPGAASLVLYVRDIDALVAAAKKAKATIVTTGGAPVEISTAKRQGALDRAARPRRLLPAARAGDAGRRSPGGQHPSRRARVHDGRRCGDEALLYRHARRRADRRRRCSARTRRWPGWSARRRTSSSAS